jgi:hypothetical protein
LSLEFRIQPVDKVSSRSLTFIVFYFLSILKELQGRVGFYIVELTELWELVGIDLDEGDFSREFFCRLFVLVFHGDAVSAPVGVEPDKGVRMALEKVEKGGLVTTFIIIDGAD